jgi:PPOX class probable F420-dependent enzyme
VTPDEARRRFGDARVAVLATVDPTPAPHVVPVTFVVDGDTVWTAVDGKPKRSTRLRRLANIRANPRTSLLVQHWDEDWRLLWWVRVDGTAVITDDPDTLDRVVRLLRRKYDQYDDVSVDGPVIEITVHDWRGWSAR